MPTFRSVATSCLLSEVWLAQLVTKREVGQGEKQQPQQQKQQRTAVREWQKHQNGGAGDNWKPDSWRGLNSWRRNCSLAQRQCWCVCLQCPSFWVVLSQTAQFTPTPQSKLLPKSPACIRAGGGGNRQLKKQLNGWNGQGRKRAERHKWQEEVEHKDTRYVKLKKKSYRSPDFRF